MGAGPARSRGNLQLEGGEAVKRKVPISPIQPSNISKQGLESGRATVMHEWGLVKLSWEAAWVQLTGVLKQK
jgi:hypothetical protein